MFGKLALTPAQVNPNYIQCVKHSNNIQINYKHAILKLNSLTILINVNRPIHKGTTLGYIPKGILNKLINLEHAILDKWRTDKHPCFLITKELAKYQHTTSNPFTKVLIEISGIWENRCQYGLIYNISNIGI